MRRFELPNPPRTGWKWYVLSAVVNGAFLAALVWLGHQTKPAIERFDRSVQLIVLEPTVGAREPDSAYVVAMEVAGDGQARPGVTGDIEVARNVAPMPRAPIQIARPPVSVPNRIEPLAAEDSTLSEPVGRDGQPLLRPSFGGGRVWVSTELTRVEQAEIALQIAEVDSLLRDRLLALIAELPPDSFAFADPMDLMTTIAGQPFGMDAQFIQLGPLKIPTALLALLPLPGEGNVYRERDAREGERMRQEIIQTARRQGDMATINQYIKEMRERRDKERREARQGIIVVPDSVPARPDSVINRGGR